MPSPTTSAICQLFLRPTLASKPRRYFFACSRDWALFKQIRKAGVKLLKGFLPLVSFRERHGVPSIVCRLSRSFFSPLKKSFLAGSGEKLSSLSQWLYYHLISQTFQ